MVEPRPDKCRIDADGYTELVTTPEDTSALRDVLDPHEDVHPDHREHAKASNSRQDS